MLTFSKYRTYIALGSAAVFIVTGMLPLNQIAAVALEICKKLRTDPVPFTFAAVIRGYQVGIRERHNRYA